MGFWDFLFKNAPGSPGHTASAISKQFNYFDIKNYDREWKNIFINLIEDRKKIIDKIGNLSGHAYDLLDSHELAEACDGDLSTLVFIILYVESKSFRTNVAKVDSEKVIKIIYETVSSKAKMGHKDSLNSFLKIRDFVLLYSNIFEMNDWDFPSSKDSEKAKTDKKKYEKISFKFKKLLDYEFDTSGKQRLIFMTDRNENRIVEREISFDMSSIKLIDANKTIAEIILPLKHPNIYFLDKEGVLFQNKNGEVSIKGWGEKEYIEYAIKMNTKRIEENKLKFKDW